MDIGFLFIYTLFAFAFSALLMKIGWHMYQIKSVKKHILAYQKNPKKFSWIEHYFMGYRWANDKVMLWVVDTFGDRFYSAWQRFAGLLFIVFGIFFVAGTIFLWYQALVGIPA